MIKAVIFDCFGVLTGDVWKEFVLSLPEEQKQPARDLNHALDRGFLDEKEFTAKIHELTGATPEKVEHIINAEMGKNKATFDFIRSLKKTKKIGLLSNVSSNWVRETFLSPNEAELFDDILLSYEVGMIKPEPELFKIAADRLGVEINECILVDDGLMNCKGAENVGMKAVYYHDFDQFEVEINKLLANSDN